MLQKMGHFSSRVAFKMTSRQKCQFPQKISGESWPIHLSPKMTQLGSYSAQN